MVLLSLVMQLATSGKEKDVEKPVDRRVPGDLVAIGPQRDVSLRSPERSEYSPTQNRSTTPLTLMGDNEAS
jgi:hypothetical protein